MPAPPASGMTVTVGQRAQVIVPGERTREVTLDPGDLMRALRSEDKGQAGACPDGRGPSPARCGWSRGPAFKDSRMSVGAARRQAVHSNRTGRAGGRDVVVSDAEPGFGPPGGRSVACAGQAHRDCGHVRVAHRRPVSRHRLESTITLCRCPCHAACPLADRRPVSLTVWQQLCACPGAEEQRAWKEDRDEPRPGVTKESREKTRREWFRRVRKMRPEHFTDL